MRSVSIPLLVLLTALLASPSALAQDGRKLFFDALDLERTAGDLEGALTLYGRAAEYPDTELQAEARLGQSRCLRGLGRAAAAQELLEKLLAGPLPARLLEAARRELRLVTSGTEEEAIAPVEPPPTAENPQDRALRAELAAYALSQARALQREGRLAESREWVTRALEQQPLNEEARDLLRLLGETPGDRERLVREVLRVLELERRLRLVRLQSDADALLSAGQALLLRGDLDRAAIQFSECVALVDGNPTFRPELSLRRGKAEEFLASAIVRGATRPPLPDRPFDQEERAWREALRALLRDVADAARPGERILRIHDLSGFATLGDDGERPRPGELFAELLPALVEPAGWGPAGHHLRPLGYELAIYAPPAVHAEVRRLLERVATRQDPAAPLTVTMLAVSPAAVGEATRELGIGFTRSGGTTWARIPPGQAHRLTERLLSGGNGRVLDRQSLLVPPERIAAAAKLRRVNLAGPGAALGTLDYGVKLALLPVFTGTDFGLSVALAVTAASPPVLLPARTGGDLEVPVLTREERSCATRLPPGGALVLTGLGNPFAERPSEPRGGLLVLVEVGGSDRPAAAPGESLPPGPAGVDLRGLLRRVSDTPAPPFRGEPPRAVEGRAGFLLDRLREAVGEDALARPGASLSVARGVVWVEGGGDLADGVRGAIDRLAAGLEELVAVRVVAFAVSGSEEGNLLRHLPPAGRVLEGEGVRLFGLTGGEQRRVAYYAVGAPGRLDLPAVAVARSTQLVNLAHVTRHTYLEEVRLGEGGAFPIYDAVDEGLAVELRPVLRPDGRIDLEIAVRSARLLDREEGPRRPVHAVFAARVRVVAGKGEALLVTGLPAPTPVADRRDRLALLLEVLSEIPK